MSQIEHARVEPNVESSARSSGLPAGAQGLGLLLLVHLALLGLAATSFTIVTGDPFHVQFYHYGSKSDFGVPYKSDYSLSVVLAYIAAYSAGLVFYARLWRRGSRRLAVGGFVICLLGFLSFAYESTHWLRTFNDSVILSLPVILFVTGTVAAVILFVRPRE
jgi:hypothetical protein